MLQLLCAPAELVSRRSELTGPVACQPPLTHGEAEATQGPVIDTHHPPPLRPAAEGLAGLRPPVAPKVLPPVIPPPRRSSIETIPLALPARRSSTFEADAHPPLEAIGARRSSSFEVDALRPLAAIEDQGRRKSSVVALQGHTRTAPDLPLPAERLVGLRPPVAPNELPPVIPPTRRSSIETISLDQ